MLQSGFPAGEGSCDCELDNLLSAMFSLEGIGAA